jgi:hypothetical protein
MMRRIAPLFCLLAFTAGCSATSDDNPPPNGIDTATSAASAASTARVVTADAPTCNPKITARFGQLCRFSAHGVSGTLLLTDSAYVPTGEGEAEDAVFVDVTITVTVGEWAFDPTLVTWLDSGTEHKPVTDANGGYGPVRMSTEGRNQWTLVYENPAADGAPNKFTVSLKPGFPLAAWA